jgi:ATP-binding cassette, subfamily G (WHITE), member 2, PDR
MNAFGYGTPTDFQKTIANIWLALLGMAAWRLFPKSSTSGHKRVEILGQSNGSLSRQDVHNSRSPWLGCSTVLKTISGDRNGICVDKNSYFNYQGISDKDMHSAHRGDAIYIAKLTVRETLTFSARARCQKELPQGIM